MGMDFAIHVLPEADSAQQLDSPRLQRTGANSVQHMLSCLPLQYHAIDAVSIEDMRSEQSGRSSTDDRHLGSHVCGPSSQILETPIEQSKVVNFRNGISQRSAMRLS